MSDRRQRALVLNRFIERVVGGEALSAQEWIEGIKLLIADSEKPNPVVQAPIWHRRA